ncbi:MAG: DnaJ domain-containing protein [Desulfovibrio sp.]|nr:DnaJ domain-containing protein [Desulfovibrio sp.]
MRRPSRQLSLKECYEVLRLEKGADLQAVKRAYRRRAFELHPDLNPGNPEAGRQFQLLNEAYVALTALLKPEEDARRAAEAQKKPDAASGAEAASGKKRPEEASAGGAEEQKDGAEQASHNREGERAQKAYAEQDVLRDLLNDPFARRVFEDIYSELNRQQSGPRTAPNEEPRGPSAAQQPRREPPPRKEAPPRKNTKLHQGNIAWGTPNWNRDLNKGVTGVVKDWLRRQIDEEQTLRFPAAHLVPGRRIRLQIRRGLSDELHTVEVTLPADFTPGKPVRLKGLGKRVGPWQGDLYLTIYNE